MSWAATYRTLGALGFASYALSRAVERLPGVTYRRYYLIAVPRSGMPPMPRGHEVRLLDRDELLAAGAAFEASETAVCFRLKQGMSCLGAFRDGRLLGLNWVTDQPFDEDEVFVRFVPPPGAAWDTGLYLRPDERGGRGFAALWAGTAAWLADRGLDWSMSRINDYNDSSWRAHQRMGARRLDTLTALRVGDDQWLFGARPRRLRLGPGVQPPVMLLPMPEGAV